MSSKSQNTSKSTNGNKSKYAFWLRPEVNALIDSHLNGDSRSDFVEQAVRHYCGVLDTKGSQNFLGDEIVRAMTSIIRDTEGRIFSHLRSMDISQSMIAELIASYLQEMTPEEIADTKKNAVRFVDNNFRAQSFVEAWRLYQNQDDEG